MTTLNVIRYSDGRTIYNCSNYPYAPTNPKLGNPSQSNTITWSSVTHVTTFSQPRQSQYDQYVTTTTRSANLVANYTTTTQQSAYFTSQKKTEGVDIYGRSAVTIYPAASQQTAVSRYSPNSLSPDCTPKVTTNCSASK